MYDTIRVHKPSRLERSRIQVESSRQKPWKTAQVNEDEDGNGNGGSRNGG